MMDIVVYSAKGSALDDVVSSNEFANDKIRFHQGRIWFFLRLGQRNSSLQLLRRRGASLKHLKSQPVQLHKLLAPSFNLELEHDANIIPPQFLRRQWVEWSSHNGH